MNLKIPDNNETTLFLPASFTSYSIGDMMIRINNHFGDDIDYDSLTIEYEKIQTIGFVHDLMDFIVIRKI